MSEEANKGIAQKLKNKYSSNSIQLQIVQVLVASGFTSCRRAVSRLRYTREQRDDLISRWNVDAQFV